MRTLPWLLKNTTDMEHDDYTRMIKVVRFYVGDDRLYNVEDSFSLDRVLIVLEEMIPQNSRLLLQTGLIENSSQIPY